MKRTCRRIGQAVADILDWLARLRHPRTFGRARSPRWPAVREAHLRFHPTCAACGRAEKLEVHHIVPVHTEPLLELDPANLLTLCTGRAGLNCHFVFGHLCNWHRANGTVKADAGYWLAKLNGD